jgi:hypothetical protein
MWKIKVAIRAIGVVMVVPAFVVVLANAAWRSRGGGIGMDGVNDGVFKKGSECASILRRKTGLGRRMRGRSN